MSFESALKPDLNTAKKRACNPCTAAKQKTPLMMRNTQCCIVKKITRSTMDAKTTKYAALISVISSPSIPPPEPSRPPPLA